MVEFAISENELGQGVVVFTIANVTTPTRQVGAASETSIWTYDSLGNIIDSASDVSTDAITEGGLTGVKSVNSAVDTPAYTDEAVVSFTTAGGVPVGGSIRVSLPEVVSSQAGWVISSGTSVEFGSPSLSAPLSLIHI